MTLRLPVPLHEYIRKTAFDKRVPMTAVIAHACIWDAWRSLPDSEPSPVKHIARTLGMTPAGVAAVVYPADEFGAWDDSQEPELP
jgi:hypothetical protein